MHCNLCSQDGTVFSRDKACKAEKTIFGWASESPQFFSSTPTSASTCLKIAPVQENIEFLLQRIWAMEEVSGDSNNLTQNEQLAVTHFRDTHTRDVDGRHVFSLPKREPRMELGRSRKTAFRRFLINERSLKKKDKWNSFHQGVSEYLETGHAEKVPPQDMGRPHSESYYLPMHGVEKESSTTTKLRIMFDASAKSSNGTL